MKTYRGQGLDVAKDPLDLRDKYYEGSLIELPKWVDNRGKVPFILDQQKDGACTGFGLAANVNYLLHGRSGADILRHPNGASARMLYEIAKRYDEWDGTNYEGSSIRGAMKGWHKHGVCREALWKFRPGDTSGRLTRKRQEDALSRPLGNYFRVHHHNISHLHSAIVEVGILYASADIHTGWFEADAETGRIPLRHVHAGGHAFAIVGYDLEGLWIQNSWGRGWGLNGFAHITYDDWFENGYDCWVVRMGVPTRSVALEKGGLLGKALAFDYIPHESVVLSEIKPHFVNIGNNGVLSKTGRYQTDTTDLKEIFENVKSKFSVWNGKPRIVLYAHGGLNDEKASAVRIASMMPYFLGNQIYPIHFMWETGLKESICSIVEDAIRNRRFGGLWDKAKDKFLDLLDEAVELATRNLGRPIWSEMKGNAEGACLADGGANAVAKYLANLKAEGQSFELHLVGHSAGSILLGGLIPELYERDLQVKSTTLYAPACTLSLFEETYYEYLGHEGNVDRLTIFNLNDGVEQDDDVGKVYNKSLLYLVSESFEDNRKTPLLGMEKYTKGNEKFKSVFKKPSSRAGSTVIYSKGGADVTLKSKSESHGGFDNDVDTLNSTLRIITRSNKLVMPFVDNDKKK